MTSQLIFTMLNLALWIMLGYRFFRALKRRKVTDGALLYIWSVFFLLYLIVALKVPTIEAGIDERFSQLPVTMLIRSLLILGTAQVYSLLINQTDYAPSKHIQRAFKVINPLSAQCIFRAKKLSDYAVKLMQNPNSFCSSTFFVCFQRKGHPNITQC